ncbi:GNAT family N-acetyltransferase [Kribbella italica]|uniref:Ribosomal protein S18 acetylase RimI-like enzyme n=1 Tax=Kribbella italica TaxID=1540520 RepID=A0A7W9J2P9_9ACTN|nr:GNAT family N-acetyltransferase [Kribbella italica]MBB5833952.1 ribosomal protein S18 acetylase RimI-like enzyme [Kribbella italica]
MLLIRPPAPADPSPPPAGIALRAPTPEDIEPLGRTYFASYPPGVACATEPEAIEDIRRTYAGEYGVLDLAASRVAIDQTDSRSDTTNAVPDHRGFLAVDLQPIVGAALVVERGPWDDAPDCPFLIEVFTHPTHRRQGLAQALLTTCLTPDAPLALRVQDNNTPAIALYQRLGFRPS